MNPEPLLLTLGRTSVQAGVLVVVVLAVQWALRKQLTPRWRAALWLVVVARLLLPFAPGSTASLFNLLPMLEPQLAAPTAFTEPQPAPPTSELAVPRPIAPHPPVPMATAPLPAPPEAPALESAGVTPAVADSRPSEPPSKPAPAREPKPAVFHWPTVLFCIWATGVLLLGGYVGVCSARLIWRCRRLKPVTEATALAALEDCARRMGVRRKPEIVESADVASPALFGLFRPRLMLPAGFLHNFNEQELRFVLVHELAHLRRRDLALNWLVTVLQILHWFNPLLWLGFARWRADRELACDALALEAAGGEQNCEYGRTILRLLEGFTHRAPAPGLVGILEDKRQLKRRIGMIANFRPGRSWSALSVAVILVLAVIGLTDAQTPKAAKPDPTQTNTSHVNTASPSGAAASQNTQSEPRSFAIRVVEYDTGAPRAGVNVEFTLKYYGGDFRKIEANTDQDGRAVIHYPATELKSLAYQARSTNHLALRGEWFDQQVSALDDEYEIKLSPGVEIGGTVVDESGNPIAGAEVTFDEPMNMLLSAGRAPWIEHAERWTATSGQHLATTDENGQWKSRCIWPGIQWASLRVHHPDYADATCSTELTIAMEAEGKGVKVNFDDLKEHRARLTLPTGTRVNGRVVNEAGNPLSGIQVNWAELVVSPHSHDKLYGQRTLTTDAAGRFTVEHAPLKPLFFWVQTPDQAPAVAEHDPASGAEIELRLTRGVALEGEVLDGQSTSPLAGARITLADFSIWRGIHWETISDENGRFAWNHAPSERFQLQIEKEGFIAQGKVVQARSDEKLSIRLNRTLHITGRVLDADTGEPVESFRADWLDRGDPEDFEHGYRVVTLPGSNGVYSLDLGRLYADMWFGGYAHQCMFRIRADGYAPTISRVFSSRSNDVGNVAYDIELRSAPQISGTVLGSDGAPVVGAQVALKLAASRLLLSGTPLLSSPIAGSIQPTDEAGHFQLNADAAAQGLVVAHQAGFAEVTTNECSSRITVRLQPWGRIEGTIWEYNNLVTNQGVWASSANATWPESLRLEFRTDSDAQGQFAFDFVPPGKYRVYRMIPMGRGSSSGPAQVVEVRPGLTSTVKVGGEGRPVIGRFKITNPYVPIDWQGTTLYARSSLPQRPKDLKTREDFEAWRQQPEIQRAYDAVRNYPVRAMPDGSFRMDEVVPGKYEMDIRLLDPRDADAFAYSKHIANATKDFTVPEPDAGVDSGTPWDIGTLEFSLKPDLKLGETTAPEFEATDMDGNKLKLTDFRGKHVLLDFWATWCGPCIGEIPYLRQVQEKFGGRQDFVIISLSLDKSIDELRAFLAKNDLGWKQAYLGDWSGTRVPGAYGVEGIPALFLINPEGKIIESGLAGRSLVAKLQEHLKASD